jgi:uncharacterized protein
MSATIIASSYSAPTWLQGGHAQTIYAAVLAPRPRVSYRRVEWQTPDGDFIELDWIDGAPDAPLTILFHGLEGGSGSHYAASLMSELRSRDWCGVVVHFRGCAGRPNRLPRAYHSGDSDEIDWILRRIATEHALGPRFALGVSLGGNALLKWLGAYGLEAARFISAAAVVSAPVDLQAAGHGLGRGINRLYTWHFLRTLKRKSVAKAQQFPGLYDVAQVKRARNLFEFDNLVTAPLHGFKDATEYWTRASSKGDLGRIALPTLMIHARNDPFLPGEHLPGPEELPSCLLLEYPASGGHAGFVTGHFPGRLDWLPKRALRFFAGACARPSSIPDIPRTIR